MLHPWFPSSISFQPIRCAKGSTVNSVSHSVSNFGIAWPCFDLAWEWRPFWYFHPRILPFFPIPGNTALAFSHPCYATPGLYILSFNKYEWPDCFHLKIPVFVAKPLFCSLYSQDMMVNLRQLFSSTFWFFANSSFSFLLSILFLQSEVDSNESKKTK